MEMPSDIKENAGDGSSDGIAQEAISSQAAMDEADRRERALLKIAQGLKRRFKTSGVKRDGNCLFRAIGRQTIGEDKHAAVRSSILEEVNENRDRYLDFAEDFNVDKWIVDMNKDGIWGDGIAVRAAANAYQLPICVWRKRNPLQDPSIFLPEDLVFKSPPPNSLGTR